MDSQKNDKLRASAFGGMVWIFAERFCAKGVSLCVAVVLARLLMPEDYSLISIVMIFFAFCNVLIFGGLNSALIQKKNADELDYSSVFWATLGISVVLYCGAFLCAPLLAEIYDKAQLTAVLRVMALTFFINALKSVLNAYTSSTLQFRKFFLATIVGTVISAVVGIAMALKGFGVWALVAQEMTNSVIDTLLLLVTTRMKVRIKCSLERLKGMLRYGLHNFASTMIGVFYDQLNPLIIGLRFSAVDLAYYTKGNSFPGLIKATLTDTMSGVLFPVMSKVQDNIDDVRNVSRRYIKTASYVIFPVMLGLFAVAETFVRLLLMEKWLSSVIYMQIFCVAYMFDLINVGNVQALRSIGRSDVVLKLEVVKRCLCFALVGIFLALAKQPEAMAVCSVVCTFAIIGVNVVPVKKLLGYCCRDQLADALPNLLLSAVMAVPVWLMNLLPIPDLGLLPLQILAGVGIYVLLSLLVKNENFFYLLKTVRQMLKK